MHTIKNESFQASVKETGAELCSFKSLKSQKEYIWQANPDVWASHAPNLFPIIGCLKNGSFVYKNKEYKCPKHGFVRNNNDVALIDKGTDHLTFGLKHSEKTLAVYPFKFDFKIRYKLEANSLSVEHSVLNQGTGDMLFSLGGHPGFNCPMNEGENYRDYFLEFEKPETAESWLINSEGLIEKETVPVFDEPKIIKLHPHLFDNDALVFKKINSSMVSLKSNKSQQVLSVGFEGFPYLGIWAKPNAPYVCIEPWIGIADSASSDRNFENKEGLVTLKPGQPFVAKYTIYVEEQ